MEPKMISLKVLSTAAVMALVIPMAAPTVSFAQNVHAGKAGPPRAGVARGAGPRFNGGGGARVNGGGGVRYGGGGYGRGYGGGGGVIPGVVAGAVIGGAIAAGAPYGYGGPVYAPGYYDDGSDDGVVAVAPGPGGDGSVAYCMQTYRSYDPQSGTYMGTDGFRHPCP
jgi:BA14K-like protein